MPPNSSDRVSSQGPGVLLVTSDKSADPLPASTDHRPLQIVWRNVFIFAFFHLAALYGAFLSLTQAKWQTNVFTLFLVIVSSLGVTAGAHRLWSHKSYKAKLPLKILLAALNTIAFQNSVIEWSRDHRMHHKYSDTDADPHNSTRGFFFSHVGWLMCRKHPQVKEKGHTIDMSDLYKEPVLAFQHKYYFILMPLACFILPAIIPMFFWGERLSVSWHVASILRFVYVLNITWLLNSAAHMFGTKPYNKDICAVEKETYSIFVLGEGFHNYHHTFPWDYKTAELGGYTRNLTKGLIDTMAMIGWAYDLKSTSAELIEKRVKRTGDGSHNLWGWGDKDQNAEDLKMATIDYKMIG